MEKLEQILTIIGSVLPFVAAALTFLIKFVKNEKVKKGLQQAAQLTEILQPLVVKAEDFLHYTGEEKKQFVLTKANSFAIEKGFAFDAQAVGELVDRLVDTTKKVNSRDKDKAKSAANMAEEAPQNEQKTSEEAQTQSAKSAETAA